MKLGSILVFIAVLSLCGAAIQICKPILESVKEESQFAYWAIGTLCLLTGVALPFVITRFWNRFMEARSNSEKI